MDLTNLYYSLRLILPEVIVSVALLIIVIADLILHRDKKSIPYIALTGMLAALAFMITDLAQQGFAFIPSKSQHMFGMVAVDAFGTFFKILIIISSVFIVFFSNSSLEIQKVSDRIGEYYTLIYGMILGMMFMISASDLILIYLSIELLSLSSYVLAGFTKLRDRNSEASLKYIIYGAVSSGIMLFGISILYGISGTTNLMALNKFFQSPELNLLTLSFSLILIFAGIGYKISAAPFHFWTPDVYEGAPIAITAYLSVASKAAGFALLIRFIRTSFVAVVDAQGNWILFDFFDWRSLLIIISILTMTLGNFSALWQNNLKRMLAYSSIAHAGYILLGLAVLSVHGLIAIMVYFLIYLLMNLGAFFIVMLIADKSGSENIDDYSGLGYTSPLLGVALSIFLISLTGIPPTAGFIAKLYLFIALVDANMIAVAVIALLNTVVSLYYYVRVLKHMYLTKPSASTSSVRAVGINYAVVLILTIPVILFGLYFTPILEFVKNCISILSI